MPVQRCLNALLALAFVVLLGTAPQSSLAAGGAAPATALRDPDALSVLISGMIQYTRWPSSATTVRVCIMGHDALVEHFRNTGSTAIKPRALVPRQVKADMDLRGDCDVVYFAGMSAETTRPLLRPLIGLPILTLGDIPEFCSDGGLFCLEPSSATTLRFHANLDSIARSKLRVNPQVLHLGRPRDGNAP